jgi:DNA-binding transcriptional MerR regulator
MLRISVMKDENENIFSLDELCSLTDTPKRTIRFYIQKGLIDRPEGTGRGAVYKQNHLEQLLTIKKWKEAGISLEKIAELLSGKEAELPPPSRLPGTIEVWSHVVIDHGIELKINPEMAGLTGEQTRQLIKDILEKHKTLQTGGEIS